jgi:hypothetical protein
MVYCKPPSLKKKKKKGSQEMLEWITKNIDHQKAETFMQELEQEYPKK